MPKKELYSTISSKKRIEPRAEILEAYYSVFTHASEAILIIKNDEIVDCNKAAESLFKVPIHKIIGHSLLESLPRYQSGEKTSRKKISTLLNKALKGIPQNFEWIYKRADNSSFIAQVSFNRFTIRGEIYISAFLRDISDTIKRTTELELYQSDLEGLVSEKTYNLEKLNEELSVTIKELVATNNELNQVNNELNKTIKKYDREKKVIKELQNLLGSSQIKLKGFISQSADGLAIIDHEAKVIEWNQKMVEITGIEYINAIFMKMYDIEFECIPRHLRTPEKYLSIKESTLSFIAQNNQEIQTFEGELEDKNKLIKILSITIFPIKANRNILFGYIFRDISQKRKQEKEIEYYQKHLEELVESKTEEVYDLSHQFNELFNNSSDSIFFIKQNDDGKFQYTRINQQGQKAFNISEKGLILPIDIELVAPKNALEDLKTHVKRCLESNNPVSYEGLLNYPKKDSIWSTTLIPYKDKNGKTISFAGFSRDITIAKQIQDVEEFVVELYKSSQSLIMVFNRDGRIINFNAECERITGYSFNDFKGYEFWNHPVIIEEDKKTFKKQFERIVNQEISNFDQYTNWKTKDNKLKWIYLRNTPIRDKNGELKYLIGTGIDLTERKQFEVMLQESEAQYRSLFETMNDALVIIDPIINEACEITDFSIIDHNLTFKRFIGQGAKKLKGSIFSDLFGNLKEEFIKKLIAVYKNGKSTRYEGHDNKLDKSFSSSIFQPRKGHLAILFSDITDQRIIENALIASERKFRNIFDSSEDGIAIISQELTLVQGNPSLQRMLAASNEQLYQGTIFDNISPNSVDIVKQAIEDLFDLKTISNLELELIGYDGRKFYVELSARLIEYEGKQAILTIIRDTTERKTMEKILLNTIIETEERERRRLAGDLHDEMGPILASLRMYLSILQQKLKGSEHAELLNIMLNLIKNSIENIRTISNNISPHLIERYGLASAINAEVENVKLLLPITFETNTTGIKFSRDVEIIFYRIIKELINNTIKYAKANSVSISINYDQSWLNLIYSDDGIGIDLEKIELERNKGLGLFNIFNRIKSIDGNYSYTTSPGKGFNFKLSAKTILR